MAQRTTYFCDVCEREMHHIEMTAKLFHQVKIQSKYVKGCGQVEDKGEYEICCGCYRKVLMALGENEKIPSLDTAVSNCKEFMEPAEWKKVLDSMGAEFKDPKDIGYWREKKKEKKARKTAMGSG